MMLVGHCDIVAMSQPLGKNLNDIAIVKYVNTLMNL